MTIEHGGNVIATAKKLGCGVSELIDMSSNLTPFATASDLLESLHARLDEIAYLPETNSDSICALFAARYNLDRSQVLAGNGTTEYINSIPAVSGAKRALIVNPTYSDYLLAAERVGLTTASFQLQAKENFQLDFEQLSSHLQGNELVFICNPNNPTGVLTPTVLLHEFIRTHRDTQFLIDETYLPFTGEKSLLELPIPENLYILRSFSKIYGIPGLRLGFLAASTTNTNRIFSKQRPWGVNRLAQLAGEHLIKHGDRTITRVAEYIGRQRPAFVAELEKLPGIRVVPGSANFILSCSTGGIRAESLKTSLLRHRIMIRNCASFVGLDDRYFRVSLKDEQSNRKCLAALQEIFNNTNQVKK
jgi:threonine-phosphate decarboxylase